MPKLLLLSAILLLVGCCGDKQDKQEQNMSITVNLRYTGMDGNADDMSRELYDAISGGRADFLRDHKRFPEDITQAVERLENML